MLYLYKLFLVCTVLLKVKILEDVQSDEHIVVRCYTSNYTLTWSYQMKDTRLDKAPLLVINQGAEDYISIDPGFIEFTMRNYTLHYGYLIPGSVTLKVNTENISVLINMDVLDAHHMNVFLFKYTRFHMRCKGYIRVNDHTEVFNQVEITELFRFR